MKITGLDTETTGLDPKKGHKIIELCLVSMEVEDEKWRVRFDYTRRFNPRRGIEPAAEAVHGISLDDLEDEPFFEDEAHRIVDILQESDLVVAHNLDFDAVFLQSELERVGRSLPDVEGFCTMEQGRWATVHGKLPNLRELCFACNVDYNPDEAHAAKYDVIQMLRCLKKGVTHEWYTLPTGVNDVS